VRSYHVAAEVPPTGRRLTGTLLITACAVVVVLDVPILHREIGVVEVVVFALLFGASAFFRKPEVPYEVETDKDQIRMVIDGSVKRTIPRDQIRYAREWKGNHFRRPMLVISSHGPIATRLAGGIAVPKSLPEYDQIKAQVFEWLASSRS
jgi:hypothetical protein